MNCCQYVVLLSNGKLVGAHPSNGHNSFTTISGEFYHHDGQENMTPSNIRYGMVSLSLASLTREEKVYTVINDNVFTMAQGTRLPGTAQYVNYFPSHEFFTLDAKMELLILSCVGMSSIIMLLFFKILIQINFYRILYEVLIRNFNTWRCNW